MSKLPSNIVSNLEKDPHFYSLYHTKNIERCKVDKDYLGEVMLVNEDLIWHSIHKYIGKPENLVQNNCIEKDDILQLGRLGFIKAIYAFDITRGVKFSSFAVTAIVREVRCFLRDKGSIIRPTRTASELMYKIKNLQNELGYLPQIEELEILLDECPEKITKAITIGRSIKYLDEPINSKCSNVALLDLLDDSMDIEESIIDKLYVDSLLEAVKSELSNKEYRILELRVKGLNQTQVAKQEDVSQMRVNRLMRKVAKIIIEKKLL